jgi:arginase
MGLGPEQILDSGLRDVLRDLGIEHDSESVLLESEYPTEISAAFQLSRIVAERVSELSRQGRFPVVLSGNCNAAVGTVSGCGAGKTGIVWFDAHGEATTPETTVSGFLDGMGISTLLGCAWQTLAKSVSGFAPVPGNRIVLFGARDLEPAERTLLESAGVRQAATVRHLAKHLAVLTKQVQQIYLHLDLDVLDPTVAKANQWTPPSGITIECLLEAITEIRKHTNLIAVGIGSYDPSVDRDGRALSAALAATEAVFRPH